MRSFHGGLFFQIKKTSILITKLKIFLTRVKASREVKNKKNIL